MASHTGHFIWTELMTKDIEASRPFYEKLFGWTIKPQQMGEMPYHVIHAGEKQVGGMMQITPQMGEVPTHCMAYGRVDDADQRCQKAQELGGKQLVPGMDIPEVGRFTVVQDPYGAVISPFKGLKDMEPPAMARPVHGEFCWYEVMTPDADGTKKFYTDLFGWQTEGTTEHGGDEPYTMFKAGDRPVAGIAPMPGDAQHPPYWLSYVAVEDVDATARKCTELGGKVHVEPLDIPNVGRVAVIEDNIGGVVALYKGANW